MQSISQFISIISFSIEITIKEETAKNGGHLRSGSTVVGTRGGGDVFLKFSISYMYFSPKIKPFIHGNEKSNAKS